MYNVFVFLKCNLAHITSQSVISLGSLDTVNDFLNPLNTPPPPSLRDLSFLSIVYEVGNDSEEKYDSSI